MVYRGRNPRKNLLLLCKPSKVTKFLISNVYIPFVFFQCSGGVIILLETVVQGDSTDAVVLMQSKAEISAAMALISECLGMGVSPLIKNALTTGCQGQRTLLEQRLEKEGRTSVELLKTKLRENKTKRSEEVDRKLLDRKTALQKNSEDLEEEINDVKTASDEIIEGIEYGFNEEEFFAKLAYGAQQVDYLKMWYGDSGKSSFKFNSSEEYWNQKVGQDTQADFFSSEEAGEKFKEIQYAAAVGARFSVSMENLRKFDLWIKFNPALFRMFETMHAFTQEVNYAPPR